ncbi:RelA/SpoT family protein [Polymorphobacter fuscus]|uniref:GTP pyrophosphokinase rsh n=1 Tax=Sandarakinorhabdus fusca TaxID=1439888 RepID=A0A7C9KLH5_9SPHN|nr:bifunctional (p)ppGpp synthetase/guanosine-3',5'-bis(diphosphate) 3'-pyrophosphohydrolase [Polymorphobacter fuscus]KAB7647839.1 bifunctional (p)ppGpp synthetase/guanosine-3',5'-bis(diphosphate) 3'-pyrophosphohydrolase [Polymorphobacter fuscus]MQT17143.1 RelA/SpoT family protein [Polymorphobacter fuscus]NJC08864.1 GTP pyrophosphokinase [Polymorphobacter fuscus]
MLRQYELVERVKAYDPDADEDLLNRAYVFSMKAHGSQLRASGDPYFSHPIEVAGILTELKLDAETIATGILHDTIEDTVATQEQIIALFGTNVGRLVDGVTKLSKIEAQTDSERQAENLRKFLLAMSNDIRVLLVKLADRLHNMRTLHFIKSEDKRRRIARETMDIYAPLAERIGMYGFMDELQELAFRQLEPDAHATIAARLAKLREGGGDTVARIASGMKLLLAQKGIDAEVTGREKRPFSIWRKMQGRGAAFETLSDVMAFRVIVADTADCYRALGTVHTRWPMVPGRFKDFISTPKRNGYKSIHTTVLHSENSRIEVQIRTRLMHEEAEFGLAAHWAYKQGGDGAKAREAYPWLDDLLEVLHDAASPEELLENARLAMFQDQVFAFTPKGALHQLPRNSTPVDFAYAVHSDLGDSCIGAKVNGRIVPLRTKLANGDQVEIMRSKIKAPDPAWEGFVVSAKARAAIRRHVRQKALQESQAMGSKLLESLALRLGIGLGDDMMGPALGRLKLADRAALELAMARNQLTDAQVSEALVPGSTAGKKPRRMRGKPGPAAVVISGMTAGVAFELGACHPVPGDRIVGIRHPDQPIMIHTIDCASLADEAGEWVEVSWGPESDGATARLAIVVHNQPGSLASLAASLAAHHANIVNLSLKHRDREFHTDVVDIEVEDLKHLTAIIGALRQVKAVVSVERMRG